MMRGVGQQGRPPEGSAPCGVGPQAGAAQGSLQRDPVGSEGGVGPSLQCGMHGAGLHLYAKCVGLSAGGFVWTL